jgi:polyisoprenoid-binding protein YceI
MMKRWIVALGLATALTVPAMAAGNNTWQIEPNSSTVQFVVRHLGISNIQGDFTKVSGTVVVDEADISKSSVNATIDAASVDTRVTARDNDIKSDHFFDVAKFPTITFQSTKIWKTGDGAAKMTGNFTLHGVTKEVTLDVTGPTPPITDRGVLRRGVEATTKINRTDFGITYDPLIVGDEISVTIDLEMTQASPGAPEPGARGPAGPPPAKP